MSRRAPLSNLPNEVNSNPYSSITAAAAKRQRSLSTAQRETTYGQQPPQKKQIVEVLRTPVRNSNADSKVNPSRRQAVRTRTTAGTPPAYNGVGNNNNQQIQRKAVAKPFTDQQNSLESVRAWQRHYRRMFPSYVFYFESLPDDVAAKFQKQIQSLGAKLEKFFSNEVTHVVTSRPIPPETTTTAKSTPGATINPSLLERETKPRRVAVPRQSHETSRDAESRKPGRGASDILLKAREYGMKIWALEKLQRMMHAMFDTQSGQAASYGRENDRAAQAPALNVDLSHVLRNEKIHGPTDRDPNAVPKDLVFFKGPFLYVHDLLAINRPIMVREYQKVKSREQGAWPQFRSVSGGRCPFIEEAVHKKREEERERHLGKVERAKEKETAVSAPKAKASTKTQQQTEEQPKIKAKRPVLGEFNKNESLLNNSKSNQVNVKTEEKDDVFQVPSAKRDNSHPNNEMAFTATNPEKGREPTKFGAEPVASGVQPSNITSAIRSQMVSSLADQPGQRAGTSKELYELKRKVAGNVLIGNVNGKGITHSQRMMDLAKIAGGKDREAKVLNDRKRKLGVEEPVMVLEDKEVEETRVKPKSKEGVKKETRPGYCENCREKFEDFEDHTYSRRHRKFAADNKNWAELDNLLSQLVRPPRV
ncbi:uncharacterized protein LAJ45_01874 [Morchella importuna]|uniref:DBF4-type domain-containing protein n=1 Tax=Morchella conica CCBAS932 TaxID=1392247 RepID=A0A3N4L1Z1_9PEZI|nr:uncharacterized protein LAJ45_01874 [Morchella importuna]KAH8154107.1 hypothetical protein LAJ45_01874 [Morchella importuna]RPB16830.1 hypothetical protein P167DRAFT_570009 [Morchella conica CCBAS932]